MKKAKLDFSCCSIINKIYKDTNQFYYKKKIKERTANILYK